MRAGDDLRVGFHRDDRTGSGRRLPRAGAQPGDRQRRRARAVGARLSGRRRAEPRPIRSGRSRSIPTRSSRASTCSGSSRRASPTTTRSARGGTWPATARRRRAWPARSVEVMAEADVRDTLARITAPTLILHRDELAVRRRRARPLPRRAHRGLTLRRAAGRGHAALGRRHRADARRDRGVRHRRPRRLRRRTCAHHNRFHRHRRLDPARRRTRRPPVARPARQPRPHRPPRARAVPRPRGEHRRRRIRRDVHQSQRGASTAPRRSSTPSARSASRCGWAFTPARSRCAAPTSRAWRCTSARASRALAGPSEVLVSSTVREIVTGSRRSFTERGEHELKGVPGRWRVYALVPQTEFG